MLKISAFSKLCRVSVKTLRFYDELGLLKPAFVDENNGYRYYSEEQLLTVKRIAAFKEQGFTLEQIMLLIQEAAASGQLKHTLAAKQTELQHTIQEAQRQLSEINTRLSRIEESSDLYAGAFSAAIRRVESQLAASIRQVVPRTQLCLLLDEVTQYVRSFEEEDNRSLTVIWHDYADETGSADIEVILPLQRNIPSSSRVKVRLLPELKMAASLVHHCDPYSSSCSAATELKSWIASNGYLPSDIEPIRETYLTSDRDIYGKLRIAEVIIPIVELK